MKLNYKWLISSFLFAGIASTALAKLPALSDEAKAKAAEAAAKTAWTGKVEGYLLCKAQDKTAAHYYKTNKTAKPAVASATCADPGPFVYPLPVVAAAATTPIAAAPATSAVASAAAAKPAAAAATAPAKKP